MNGLSQWARSHKPQVAAIAAAIVVAIVVAIAVASGALATSEQQPEQQESRTVDVTLNVTADNGWDENSTPAIAHIEGNDVDFYHAVAPDADGNKGTSTVALAEGDYTVSFVSPVNSDGSAFDIYDTGAPVDITVDADAKTVTVVTGSPKISLDADKLYDEVVARFESGDFSDLKFDYDTEPCAPVDLQTYYDQFATEMKDAYYDEEKKELVAEKVGFGFDVSYYTQQIAMADAGTTITIQAEEMQPEVTLADLEKEYFADVLGSCDSPHTAQAGRTKNLELACKAIDGTILNPGDEFSFNKIVGERTAEKGYQKAIVYQTGGKSEAEEGGGVCQVASTISPACLYADLKVTERAPHMFTVTYVQLGMDATIYWGSLDYKFVNSTDHPLRIDASVSGGYVHIKLMGTTPKDKSYDHIVLHNEVIATRQPKTVIDGTETEITDAGTGVDENGNTVNLVVDKQGNKYVKGEMVNYAYTGKTVKAYRDYVDASGKVLKTELLHTDTYKHRDTSYKCTPYVEPEIPEEPDEPDPTDPTEPTDPWDPGTDIPTEPTGPSPWE